MMQSAVGGIERGTRRSSHGDALCPWTALQCGIVIIDQGQAIGVLHDRDPSIGESATALSYDFG